MVTLVSSWSPTRNFRVWDNGVSTPWLGGKIMKEQIEEVECRGRTFWLLHCTVQKFSKNNCNYFFCNDKVGCAVAAARQWRFINFIVPENNPLEAGKLDRETLEVRGRRPGVRPCLFAIPSWLDQTQISQVKTTDLAQFFWEISHRLSYEDWP